MDQLSGSDSCSPSSKRRRLCETEEGIKPQWTHLVDEIIQDLDAECKTPYFECYMTNDVALLVLFYLDLPDLAVCARVCKNWAKLITDNNHLWYIQSLRNGWTPGSSRWDDKINWKQRCQEAVQHERRIARNWHERLCRRVQWGGWPTCGKFVVDCEEQCLMVAGDLQGRLTLFTGKSLEWIEFVEGSDFHETVTDVAVSKDGRKVLAAFSGGTCSLWSVPSKGSRFQKLKDFEGHPPNSIRKVLLMENYGVAACADYSIQIFDSISGKFQRTLTGYKDKVSKLLSFNSKYLITGGKDGVIRFWNLEDGSCVSSIPEFDPIKSLCIKETTLLSGTRRGVIKLFSLENQTTIDSITSDNTLYSLQVSKDSSNIVAAGLATGHIQLFDFRQPLEHHPAMILECGPTAIISLQLHDKILASGSMDSVMAWDLRQNKPMWAVREAYPVKFVDFHQHLLVYGCWGEKDGFQRLDFSTDLREPLYDLLTPEDFKSTYNNADSERRPNHKKPFFERLNRLVNFSKKQ